MNWTQKTLPGIVALIAVLSGCTGNDPILPLAGTLERDRLELVAEVSEPIVEIAVREGEHVMPEQLLLRLDDTRERALRDRARAERDRAAQALAELARGPRPERIAEARARLAGAASRREVARAEYARITALREKNLASDAELERARAEHDAAQAAHDEARAVLAALEAGATREELAQARARLAEAEASLRAQEVRFARLAIRAPRAGTIEALPYEAGERPPAGGVVAVLLADTPVYARVFVPEPLRARLTAGVEAVIRVDGLERVFAGRVRYLASEATYTPYYALTERDRSRLSFVAEIELTEPEAAALPAGVLVTVDFPALRE
ncbi:MAG TPA: HlyD family efflux transporter periplasmic adaptor subunit [Gammaproteobacteria bacterium]|nr:HlyD family efflux transporter periplasmic adaptor subunit [Gammaproteobacteria bacterium]